MPRENYWRVIGKIEEENMKIAILAFL